MLSRTFDVVVRTVHSLILYKKFPEHSHFDGIYPIPSSSALGCRFLGIHAFTRIIEVPIFFNWNRSYMLLLADFKTMYIVYIDSESLGFDLFAFFNVDVVI